jgi:rhamnosyltransferase
MGDPWPMLSGTGEHRQVHAVVVTFRPDVDDLVLLLKSLMPQVGGIVLVDNGSGPAVSPTLEVAEGLGVRVIRLPENFGIAFAQNIGIEKAIEAGAGYILLSDQDSVPAPDMVQRLLEGLQSSGRGSGAAIAAIGPATVDRRNGELSFFWRPGRWLPHRWKPGADEQGEPVEVEFLIASGTLVPVPVIQAIGGMRSRYFIDHVDTEWCFRAKAAGYRLLGSAAARLHHRLGDDVRKIWFLRTRSVMHHSPLRDFYMFRNTLLMLRDTRLSIVWIVHLLGRLVQFSGYFLLFGSDRVQRARMMLSGLGHGLVNRGGRRESDGSCTPVPTSPLEPLRRGGA